MGSSDATSRTLVTVLLGDVVLPRGGAVWASTVGEAMEALGVTPAATRQVLRRLASDDLVSAHRDGRRARYVLTGAGRRHVGDAVAPLTADPPRRWDGQWRVLAYSFPESDRSDRDRLRRDLVALGYGSAGTGTWVSPWDLGPAADPVLAAHRDAGRVDRFTATFDGDDRDLARRAFDLDRVGRAHRRFVEERGHQPPPTTDLDAVARRVALVHDWLALLADTPRLPPGLLPDGWPGHATREHVRAALGQLEPRVSRWWTSRDVDRGPRGDGAPSVGDAAPRPREVPAAVRGPQPAHRAVRVTVPAGRPGPAWSGFRRTVVLALADDALMVGARLRAAPLADDDPDAAEVVDEVAEALLDRAGQWYASLAGDDEDPMELAIGRPPDGYRHAPLGNGPVDDLAQAVAIAHVAMHGQGAWLDALADSEDPALRELAGEVVDPHRDLLDEVERLVARRARDPRSALATGRAATAAVVDGAWMFETLPGEGVAVERGDLPRPSADLRSDWWAALDRSLRARHLVVPEPGVPRGPGGRRGLHGPEFLEHTWPSLRSWIGDQPRV